MLRPLRIIGPTGLKLKMLPYGYPIFHVLSWERGKDSAQRSILTFTPLGPERQLCASFPYYSPLRAQEAFCASLLSSSGMLTAV